MRASFDIKLTLSESESTALAVAAYNAGMTVGNWIRHQLLGTAENGAQEQPAPTLSASVHALAPPAAAPVPVAAPEPAPQAPPPTAAPPTPPRRAAERPAPTSPATAPPAAASKKTQTPRSPTPAGVIPRGFDDILALSEKMIAARKEIMDRTGFTTGRGYNIEMMQWYAREGLSGLPTYARSQLSDIGKNAEAIRRWKANLRIPLKPDIKPYTLLKQFQEEAPTLPAMEAEPAEPEPAVATSPTDETLVFESGKLVRKSLSAHLAGAPQGNGAVEPAKPETNADRFRAYNNFNEVDLDSLDNYDARVLERFTKRIENLGGADETLPEDKIALAIRKIRGGETGDNPPCAIALTRIGVLFGKSGAYRLRREYCQRFERVKGWARVKA